MHPLSRGNAGAGHFEKMSKGKASVNGNCCPCAGRAPASPCPLLAEQGPCSPAAGTDLCLGRLKWAGTLLRDPSSGPFFGALLRGQGPSVGPDSAQDRVARTGILLSMASEDPSRGPCGSFSLRSGAPIPAAGAAAAERGTGGRRGRGAAVMGAPVPPRSAPSAAPQSGWGQRRLRGGPH